MNDQIATLITELAQKLGTTTEYVWGFMVKNAMLEGISSGIAALMLLTFAIFEFHCYHKLYIESLKEEKKMKDESNIFIGAVSFIAGILMILTWSIPCLLNPEYYAFQDVLKMLIK